MYWADELAAAAEGPQVVNDSKTPSGTVHVGSLRGVVLHDAIRRALLDLGTPVTFRYGVEDLDPMDAQSLLTPDAVERYMGVPLAHVPAPEGSTAANYARHFVGLFLGTFEGLGITPELYWMSERYAAGDMDPYIARALDHADVIRDIYRTVSTVDHPAHWLPISVICENCGRSGTTIASGWDGHEVTYECRADLVEWATGCGHHGRTSPFGGRAKLVWNVDWAARWGLVGATIEGCGKDLATKGGSRDRADAISRRVFEREPPTNVPYEFLTIGGKKMSTSKGSGAAAHEIAELLPPELLRFLFLRHKPRRHLEFDPEGDTVPGLFDEFDRIAAASAGREVRGELPPEPARIFRMSMVDAAADPVADAARFRPAFRHLTLLAQLPGVDLARPAGGREGGPARRRGTGHRGPARRCRARLAGGPGARSVPGRRAGRAAARKCTSWVTTSGSTWAPWPWPPSRIGRPLATRGRTSSSAWPTTVAFPQGRRSRPSTSPSSAASTGLARAGCWRRSRSSRSWPGCAAAAWSATGGVTSGAPA